jgi:hypothetical protein
MAKIEVDIENHVIPLLQLARIAVEADDYLRNLSDCRKFVPELDDMLKRYDCRTGTDSSLPDHMVMVLCLAIEMLNAKNNQ